MNSYFVKRLLLCVPTLILVTMLVFVLMRLIPGDPAYLRLIGSDGDAEFTQQQLDDLQAQLGTDKSLPEQYGRWIWGVVRFDFGLSMVYDTPISDDLKTRLPITLELTLIALVLATVIAVPLGIVSAIFQDSWADYLSRIIAIAGIAMPTFWTGILTIILLILFFGWLPPLGYAPLWDDPLLNLQQMVFPAIALGFYNMALIARVMRSAMLEVLREDYIRTARSKGLSERVIIVRHALKNASLPVLTISGWQVGRLVAGTVVIEKIFLVPGMGKLLIDSIFARDFTMIQAIVLVVAVLVLGINLFVDLMYGWLDPRIRLEG
jgi:peptide/nickel transport system permease protein